MAKGSATHRGILVLLTIGTMILYSCGSSSPNTMVVSVSSESARIVPCPTTTVAAVAISNFTFRPASVSIAVNNIVQWTTDDAITHTATSGTPLAPDGKFDSGQLASNASVQFLIAGSYPYFCNIHPFMTGTVTVQ